MAHYFNYCSWRLYFLFFLLTSAFLNDEPYCALRYRRLCQGKGQHVACQYSNPGPGPECRNYSRIIFTADLKRYIINYINKRRQRIAAGTERVRGGAIIPKPQIMMMVVWDRELAYLAQRLADQCSFVHDDCRATVRYPYAGQTVGEVRWRGTSDTDALSAQRAMRRVLDAWWGEKRRVLPQELMAPFKIGSKSAAWGHFSQLAVWALTAAGCGAARHGNPRRFLLVCDFSHTNMLGQSTLVPGDVVSCPARFARKARSPYPLLCAPERKQDRVEEEYEYSLDDYATSFLEDSDNISGSAYSEVSQSFFVTKIRTSEVDTYRRITKDSTKRKAFSDVTKPQIIRKLEQQLEVNRSTGHYAKKTYQQIVTSRTYIFGNIRDSHENEFMSKAKLKMGIEEPLYHNFEDVTTVISRQKWKKTRQRPRRPGADALVSKPAEKIFRHSSPASLTLDREDMEQLFRDTGFHKGWKKERLP